MNAEEVWKQHPVYPIEVSTHGNVRRLGGKLMTLSLSGKSNNRTGLRSAARYLVSSAGVSRPNGNGGKSERVHVLVLETFVGPRPPDHEADHEDMDGFNNHLSNLRWLPSEENQARRRRNLSRSGTTQQAG